MRDEKAEEDEREEETSAHVSFFIPHPSSFIPDPQLWCLWCSGMACDAVNVEAAGSIPLGHPGVGRRKL